MSSISPPRNDGHPYQDPARPVDERVADLLARMTPEEKAGLMFHSITALEDEEYAPGETGAPLNHRVTGTGPHGPVPAPGSSRGPAGTATPGGVT